MTFIRSPSWPVSSVLPQPLHLLNYSSLAVQSQERCSHIFPFSFFRHRAIIHPTADPIRYTASQYGQKLLPNSLSNAFGYKLFFFFFFSAFFCQLFISPWNAKLSQTNRYLSIECVDFTTFQTTNRLDKLQIRVMAFHHFVFYYPFPISIVAPPSWLVASKATHKLSQFQVCLSHHLFIIGSHLNSTRMSSSGLGLASSSPPTSIASTPWKHLRILIAFNYYSYALALQLK